MCGLSAAQCFFESGLLGLTNADKRPHLMPMAMKDQIIIVADRYAAAVGIGRKRLSTIVFNRGAKIDDIADGGDLATGTYERAMRWFSENWPASVEWPEGIDRPDTVAVFGAIFGNRERAVSK
jgi:hypothetical protein